MIGFDAVAAQAVAEDLNEATTWDVATDRDGDRWRVLVIAPHTGEILRILNTQADVDAWVKAGGHEAPRAGQERPILNRYAVWFAPGLHIQTVQPTRLRAAEWATRALVARQGKSGAFDIDGLTFCYQCDFEDYGLLLDRVSIRQVEVIEIDAAGVPDA